MKILTGKTKLTMASIVVMASVSMSANAIDLMKAADKYLDKAVAKVQKAYPEIPAKQAKCVVQNMVTESGIKVKDIAKMDMTVEGLASNKEKLTTAFNTAMNTCKK